VPGEIDYRLARRQRISAFRKGRLGRPDVCDAHPELIRAARNVGQATAEACPICEAADLVHVSYVFGPRMPPSGRCVTSESELRRLSRSGAELVCYVVEVCPACSWNHLCRGYVVSPTRARRRSVPSARA
jgi:hypothetical protein